MLTWRSVIGEWCRPTRGTAPAHVPHPLAEFLVAGGVTALSFQNRFHTPVDEDGWSVFYVENQNVCTWAYRTDDSADDPAVSVRDLEASAPVYVAVGCRLDAFLTAAAVIEMALGAPINRAMQGPTRSADEVLGLDRVELPELGWPNGVTTSYFAGPDLLAFAHDESGYSFAFVGARRTEAIRDVDQRVASNAIWEFASPTPHVR